MSDDFYPTRLAWDGRRGIAKCDGVQIVLKGPPPALPDVAEIDFTPGIVAQVRRRPFDKMDDLRPIEIEEVTEWLQGLANWGRRFLKMKPKGLR